MKVLMLCNIIPKSIAIELKLNQETGGGWISSVISEVERISGNEVCICFPYLCDSKRLEMKINNTMYYGFDKKIISPLRYDDTVEEQFRAIVEKEKPDIVHIFGTEFPHTLAMVKAFNKPERTVIHIQGLVSVIARHYTAYLPFGVTKRNTFRDFVRKDCIEQQKRKFELRGKFEVEAIKGVKHVMGRTDWDKACCEMIHPDIKYHYVQEMMREEFYEGRWKYEDCEKHSIFMSQGSYPIKGLHLALEALYILKTKYADVKLYVAGPDLIHYNSIKQKIRKTYYAAYIKKIIQKWNLENHVVFLGSLNAEKMKERYLSSHVFVSPSVIENSPNSIGEAMLLGVPIVASDVGGVSSLIMHKENGFLYQADAPYMLAHYVDRILKNRNLSEQMSENAIHRATSLYNREAIMKQLLDTYKEIINE